MSGKNQQQIGTLPTCCRHVANISSYAGLCPLSDAGEFKPDTGPNGRVPGSLPTVIESNDDKLFSLGDANLYPSADVEADLKCEGVCCRS